MPVGGGRSAHGAGMAWPFGHGIDDEVFKAIAESAGPGEGERDIRMTMSAFEPRVGSR